MNHDHDFARFGPREVRELLGARDGPCISIYMPAHKFGPETQQGPIRLKNCLRDARAQAEELEIPRADFEEWTAPIRRLLEDTTFWSHQSSGLCAFAASGLFRMWRLPEGFEDLAVVGERCHVIPLLALLWQCRNFFVLALSQDASRLLECDRHESTRLHPRGMPEGLADALALDELEKSLQHHSGSAVSPATGRAATIYHGHGAGSDERKARLETYVRRIDQAVCNHVAQNGLLDRPLVLACVEELAGIYRRLSGLDALQGRFVAGNPDRLSDDELRERAVEIAASALRREEEHARERFGSYEAAERTAIELAQVLDAARGGAVEELFVAADTHRWGQVVDEAQGEFREHDARSAGDVDLLNLAAHWTLTHGGIVRAVPQQAVPAGSQVAALLRFAPNNSYLGARDKS